jgi:hypothetical protein
MQNVYAKKQDVLKSIANATVLVKNVEKIANVSIAKTDQFSP